MLMGAFLAAKGHGFPSSWCHGECPSEPPLATCHPYRFKFSLTVNFLRPLASDNSAMDIIGFACTSWIRVSRSRALVSLKSTSRKFPVSSITDVGEMAPGFLYDAASGMDVKAPNRL